ncbi:MAG: hypothetical protein JWQ28_1807 [Pedobacter sp.]|jgi:hypothetical protein|nr:hypothetical protein [Pedobacter sp.]
MSNIKFNPRTITVLIFILVTGLFRALIPMVGDVNILANFSAVGAIALFGGAYFNSNSKAFSLPLLTLFLSDLILSLTVYKSFNSGFLYEGWYLIYAAFALMVLVGKIILRNVNIINVILATFVTVFIHWIVTDFGVWYGSAMYPQTMAGFSTVLVNAIPFEVRFLDGTLGYSAIMFGLFEYLKVKYPVLNLKASRLTV